MYECGRKVVMFRSVEMAQQVDKFPRLFWQVDQNSKWWTIVIYVLMLCCGRYSVNDSENTEEIALHALILSCWLRMFARQPENKQTEAVNLALMELIALIQWMSDANTSLIRSITNITPTLYTIICSTDSCFRVLVKLFSCSSFLLCRKNYRNVLFPLL